MKLIVYGATGKTGQHVCRNALERGHDVTAFTRSPHKIEATAGLRVVQGNVLDATAVSDAIGPPNLELLRGHLSHQPLEYRHKYDVRCAVGDERRPYHY